MDLTPEQSSGAQQASSILAQKETNPAFCPGQCLHQPYSLGFQIPKANLGMEKGGKEVSTHPQHCPEDELNYNITKKQPCEDSSCDFPWRNCPLQTQMYLTKGENGKQNYTSTLKGFLAQV